MAVRTTIGGSCLLWNLPGFHMHSISIVKLEGAPRLILQHVPRCAVFSTEPKVHLTHGDLSRHHVLVEGSKITGILDWETAGYCPEFWEFCRMRWMTPAQACVLVRIFSSPRWEKEIK